ncbi:MAG: Ig-like domain-containing protein [Paludibacteraceae bacterium]
MKKIYFLFLIGIILISGRIQAQDLSGIRIYINPGHGGYDSDDRNVVIPPFTSGDHNGFWESVSNLHKGMYLKAMLDSRGASTAISRITNTTADDLPLSQIVRSANEFNADFMLSIHSNAGTTANSAVLMLFSGRSPGDTWVYPSPTPHEETSRLISTEIAKNLYSNQATSWSSGYSVQGDKTFGRLSMGGWSDGYGVLRGLTVPGVISEGSHHDYLPETYRLMNLEYKWLEAWHFLKSFATYFKSATLPKGNIAGVVKDRFLLNEAPYHKINGTHDVYLPINGATVTLLPKDTTYMVDNMNNGFYLFKDLIPGTYTLITQHTDYHNDTTEIVVEANKTSYANIRLNKIRDTPPVVAEYSPQALTSDTLMLASSVIRFKFNWDVDPASAQEAFSITPAVQGQFVFKDSYFIMEFVPDAPLDTSTVYTVKLDKTLRHFDGLSMENDFIFQFKTTNRNKLTLLAAYPLVDETNIDYKLPTFTFVFDKKLKTAELINGVQVYDMQGQLLTKNVRSLRHNTYPEPLGSTLFTLAQDLIPGQNYVVKFAKGIKDEDGIFLPDTMEFPFTASNERITDKLIVDDFEASGKLKVDTLASPMMSTASSSATTSTTLFGSRSYNLRYTFSENSGGEVLFKVINPTVEVTKDSVMGLHIYGDLSGNELLLIFTSENDTKEILLDSIHYGGWKFAEAVLTDLLPSKTYRFTGFKFKQRNSHLSKTGNVFVDNLLLYGKALTSVSTNKVKNVSIYPNPASDIIYVKKGIGQTIESIELFTLQGQLLRVVSNDYINVSGVNSGTYIVKVKLNEGTVALPVILKK